jgi:hypothetical protein
MLQLQRKANSRTREGWAHFSFHRKALTRAILTQASPVARTLCLLGAGNCNDVDLELLATRFERIHLVDLDEKALLFAKNRATLATRKKLRLHYRLDVSGTIDRLPRWQRLTVSHHEVAQHAANHAYNLSRLLGTFDCVVSTCLLSQLHLTLVRELGAKHPLYELVAQVTTKTHLRILDLLTAFAGTALLVTDLTSNELVPAPLWTELQGQFHNDQGGIQAYAFNGMLQRCLSQLAREHHTIAPCNPRVLTDIVSDDPELNRTLSNPAPEFMWLWQQGPLRQALVYTLPIMRQGVSSRRTSPLASLGAP